MKFLLTSLMFFVSLGLAIAQTRETFELATFSPPAGWEKETRDFAVSYSATDQLTRSWCRATIYRSINSSGTPATDFTSEWETLISKNYPDAAVPISQSSVEDGWTAMAGASKFVFNNEEAAATLTTITGYGKAMSIVVLMNTDKFIGEVDAFMESITLTKPTVVQQPAIRTTELKPGNQPVAIIGVTSAPVKKPIALSTTNFDDGWVSQPFADYVRVTKGTITVLLHYGVEVTDELRNGNLEGNLFDRYILPRYTVSNIRKYDNGGVCYFCVYFFEADAVDKATGRSCYIGFRVITNNGFARCIEIIAPSAQELAQEFPKQEKVEAMLNYNKFAVTEKDLMGAWDSSSGAAANMYSTVTGEYAGMNASSSADKFVFKGNGLYESNHKGAFGMVGSMKFYDQKYNGKCTVTNWDITMTNRFEGKTSIFWAQFEAVRDGWMLRLVDKEHSGMKYDLFRPK